MLATDDTEPLSRPPLNATKVEKVKTPGRYGDGGNLWLQVTDTGRSDDAGNPIVNKSWIFRYRLQGRSRVMGLGSTEFVSLAEARDLAFANRKLLRERKDPIAERDRQKEEGEAKKRQERLAAARATTFEVCAERMIAAHEVGWRNAKHRQQWRNTLATYAYPFIGNLPVADVSTQDVLAVLQQPTPAAGGKKAPLWNVKTETAARVRGRLEAVLSWAKAQGMRTGENPAAWRGHLDQLLPKRSKVRRVKHHPALPYRELPAFMAELRAREGISARALEFTILTAARTNEAAPALWAEIDLAEQVWRVPAIRMKTEKLHTVTLSQAALAVLAALPQIEGCPYLFPGIKHGRPLSNAAMSELLKGMRPGLTVHGFRSTFKDWAVETGDFPDHVSEAGLAHKSADKVRAAYARGDLLKKRRALMADWADYCSSATQR